MKLKLNTILHTKDGRKIGNAIITKVNQNNTFDITTDYGNICKEKSEDDINGLFYITFDDDYLAKELQELSLIGHKHKVEEL